MTVIKASAEGSGSPPPGLLAYGLLTAVLAAFGLYALFVAGPAVRAAATETVARTVTAEDQKFCGTFGMGPGTDGFAACRSELSKIRQSQVDRDSAAAEGIL